MRPNRTLPLLVVLALGATTACEMLRPRPEGEKLWRKLCAECHGLDGSGNTTHYMGDPWADLRDNAWKYDGDRGTVEGLVREGIFGKMPAHDDLTPAQMRALLDYFYGLRGESS